MNVSWSQYACRFSKTVMASDQYDDGLDDSKNLYSLLGDGLPGTMQVALQTIDPEKKLSDHV